MIHTLMVSIHGRINDHDYLSILFNIIYPIVEKRVSLGSVIFCGNSGSFHRAKMFTKWCEEHTIAVGSLSDFHRPQTSISSNIYCAFL